MEGQRCAVLALHQTPHQLKQDESGTPRGPLGAKRSARLIMPQHNELLSQRQPRLKDCSAFQLLAGHLAVSETVTSHLVLVKEGPGPRLLRFRHSGLWPRHTPVSRLSRP
jgi:hypothetical protein